MIAHEYAVCMTLGKKRDFAAIMILKYVPDLIAGYNSALKPNRVDHHYDIVYISQKQPVKYHDVVQEIEELMNRATLSNNADLIVDATGLGEGVIKIMRERGLKPIPIVTTNGGQVREVYEEPFAFPGATKLNVRTLREIHVPKADLIAAGQLLIQQNEVRVAAKLKWAEEAQKQFKSFRGKINERSTHSAHGVEDNIDFDDLVVCFLLGSWWFLKHGGRAKIPESQFSKNEQFVEDWDPRDYLE